MSSLSRTISRRMARQNMEREGYDIFRTDPMDEKNRTIFHNMWRKFGKFIPVKEDNKNG